MDCELERALLQRQDVKLECESGRTLPTPSYISKMFWAVRVSSGQRSVISIEGSLLRAFLNSDLHFLLILACTCLFVNANPGIFSIWTQTCHFSQNTDSPQVSEKIFSLWCQHISCVNKSAVEHMCFLLDHVTEKSVTLGPEKHSSSYCMFMFKFIHG